MPLTVYSEAGCNGTSKVLKDSEVNLAKAGVKFTIQVNKYINNQIYKQTNVK